jgi:hypothetical protein
MLEKMSAPSSSDHWSGMREVVNPGQIQISASDRDLTPGKKPKAW